MPSYRVYFNRKAEFPQVWSVDEGAQGSEVNIISYELHRVNAISRYDSSTTPNPDTPSAWLEINYAVMELKGGVAHFFHDLAWREPPLA